MSDIEIRSGGAVAVDTASVRAAAQVCAAFAPRIEAAAGAVAAAEWAMRDVCLAVSSDSGSVLVSLTRGLHGAVDELTRALQQTADLYEAADLLAQQLAGARDDPAMAARLAQLREMNPLAVRLAAGEIDAWLHRPSASLLAGWTGAFGPWGLSAAVAALLALRTYGRAPISLGTRPEGPLPLIRLRETTPPRLGTAPTTLRDLVERIPSGEDARVRVERYEMPDGSHSFAVYIAGTRSWATDDLEPFNLAANLALYHGHASAAYATVLAALEAAGAQPGDRLIDVGHSQGAMAGAYLAQDPRFDVRGVYSVGAPVVPELGQDTLHVTLQHHDDIVTMLGGGGIGGVNGSSGSVAITRDTGLSPHDGLIGPHAATEYEQTAALADGSDDPRLEAMRGQLSWLGSADRVTVFEYGAERAG